jgi:hypothetical protein
VTAKRLRVVGADEVPAGKRRLKSLAQAVASGSYLEILQAQRQDIVRSLPDEKGPAKAALHRQLRDISKEIEHLELGAFSEASVIASTPDEKFDETSV